MCFYLLVIPIPRMKELIAADDTPRRRSPANVNKRGSSHPSTHLSVTSRFNCREQVQLILLATMHQIAGHQSIQLVSVAYLSFRHHCIRYVQP
jgi:hypothetical protein